MTKLSGISWQTKGTGCRVKLKWNWLISSPRPLVHGQKFIPSWRQQITDLNLLIIWLAASASGFTRKKVMAGPTIWSKSSSTCTEGAQGAISLGTQWVMSTTADGAKGGALELLWLPHVFCSLVTVCHLPYPQLDLVLGRFGTSAAYEMLPQLSLATKSMWDGVAFGCASMKSWQDG